jgi:hypothetical protein
MDSHCINIVIDQTLADLSGTTTLRLLEAAGYRPEVADDLDHQYAMTCPACGGRLRLAGDRATCVRGCLLESARLIDVLARSCGNHVKVGQMLEQRIRGLRDKPRWRESGKLYCKNAQRLRWLALLGRGTLEQTDNIRMSQLLSWATRNHMGGIIEDGTARIIDAATVHSLYLTTGNMPVVRGEALAVFYWLDDITPVACRLISSKCKPDTVVIAPFGTAVTGLHLPVTSARILQQELPLEQPRDSRIDAWLSGTGTGGPFSQMVVLDTRLPQSWPAWGKLLGSCPNCRIRQGSDVTRDDYVRQELLARTSGDRWPILCTTLVDSLEPSRECLDALQAELRARGMMTAAAGLRGARLTATLWSDSRWRLCRTPAGYMVQDTTTNDERQITNFCLDPVHNVVFAETSEVEHQMVMDLPGLTTGCRIAGADLQGPSKLQDALRMHTARMQINGLPTVIDNLLCNKLLLPWLRRGVATLEQHPGRSMIGWTANRQVFQSAGWRLSADSFQETQVVLKTSIPALACFDSQPQPSIPLPENLPQAAKDLLAVVAALMARHYVRSKVRAVSVQNSSPARAICRAVFKGFGQVREFEFTTFRNTQNVPGIEGHPLLATGYNAAQAEACAVPAVFLTETGYAVQAADEMTLALVTSCSRWVLQRIAEWLMATDGREVSERPAFRWILGLMEEGADIMRKACHLEAWEITAPELPALQRFVRLMQPENTGSCLTLLDASRLQLVSPSGGPDIRDLALELLLLGIPASVDNGVLVTQAPAFSALLQDYWGEAPSLNGPEVQQYQAAT